MEKNFKKYILNITFIASSLSNLVNNLSEGIHKIKSKHGRKDKKCETCGIKYKYCDYFLEYTNFKDALIEYKCLCCNKNHQHNFDKNLKEQFFNTYRFSNNDNNKITLLSQKSVYPYEYMDDWDDWDEYMDDYSHLNIEDITDTGYSHA